MEYKRRISLEDDFMNWNVDDLLFGMMYYLATYQPNENRLYLTKANYEKHRKDFYNLGETNNSRKLKAHLNKLISRGLVKEDKVQCGNQKIDAYVFPYDYDLNYQIVDNEMLFYIISTRNKSAIQIYVYLLNKYLWKKKTDDTFTFDNKDLQKAIGYSEATCFRDTWVSNIIESFKREGVIDYVDFYETKIDETTGKQIQYPQRRLLFVAQKKEELRKI